MGSQHFQVMLVIVSANATGSNIRAGYITGKTCAKNKHINNFPTTSSASTSNDTQSICRTCCWHMHPGFHTRIRPAQCLYINLNPQELWDILPSCHWTVTSYFMITYMLIITCMFLWLHHVHISTVTPNLLNEHKKCFVTYKLYTQSISNNAVSPISMQCRPQSNRLDPTKLVWLGLEGVFFRVSTVSVP